MQKNQIVLMADVMDSSEHEGKQLMGHFQQLVAEANQRHQASIASPLTITLGDEFQGIATTAKAGVELIIDMEEAIIRNEYGFKLRYVLNEGAIDTPVNPEKAYEMLGPGLTEARQLLTTMKKENGRFLIRLQQTNSHRIQQLMVLLQHFIDSWHPKDRSTVTGFLAGLDYKQLAKKQGKDDSSLWRRRRSLAIDEYQTCKMLILEMMDE